MLFGKKSVSRADSRTTEVHSASALDVNVDGSVTVGFSQDSLCSRRDCGLRTNHGCGSFGLSLSPLPASSPISPPARVISIGDKTPHASASFGLCSVGCTTKSNPNMREAMAMTKDKVKPMPTTRIRRALISSLLRRFSGFIGSVFLVGRWL